MEEVKTCSDARVKYNRVIIKLSGEALAGKNGTGIDPEKLEYVCKEIAEVKNLGIDVGIVIGGGNFWRGVQAGDKMNRSTADHMGMLATVMNALALQDKLEQIGVPCQSADRAYDKQRCRAVHSAQSDPSFRKRQSGHLCLRNGQSLFFNGYGRSVARVRNRRGRAFACKKRGRRLRLRSEKESRRQKV